MFEVFKNGMKIEVLVKNGEFITKKDIRDNRKILYRVRVNNSEEIWISRQTLIESIENPNIFVKNVKLVGNSLKADVKSEYQVVKITNQNICILQRFVDNYLDENNSRDEYYEYGYSDWDYFNRMKREKFESFLKNGFMGLYHGKLEALFMTTKSKLGLVFVHTVYDEPGEQLRYYVEILSSMLKNSVFYYEYFPNSLSQSSKMKIMTHLSSFDKDRAYMFYHGCYLTEYGIDLMINQVEKKYFPNIKLNEVEYKCIKARDLETYFKNMHDKDYQGYWENKYNNVAVAGFTYFHREDFHANYGDIKYLVALYKNRIIGIIKFGTWPDANHQALSYVDVSVKYRKLGIATQMIKELNKYISSDTTFVLTDESEMGKLCGMNAICKKYITKTKVKTYSECLRDGSYL